MMKIGDDLRLSEKKLVAAQELLQVTHPSPYPDPYHYPYSYPYPDPYPYLSSSLLLLFPSALSSTIVSATTAKFATIVSLIPSNLTL